MKCDDVRKRLIELAYNETVADRVGLERHVAECDACAKALAELVWTREVLAAVASAGDERRPAVHTGRVQHVVAQRAQSGQRRWRRVAWLATAAALLVAFCSLSRLRLEIHASHVVLAWGDSHPTSPQETYENTSDMDYVSVETVEGLKDSVAAHQSRLAEINRLMDLVVTELNRNNVRFAATQASFFRRIDAVERQNNERWRAVGRGFHDWYLQQAQAEAAPPSAAVKGG